jgi:hypothetical protein
MDEDGSQDEDSPKKKRMRTGTIVLDTDEIEIASGFRPIPGTSEIQQDEAGSQDGSGDSEVEFNEQKSEQEGDEVDDLTGDGNFPGFEDNGVCHYIIYVKHIYLFLQF